MAITHWSTMRRESGRAGVRLKRPLEPAELRTEGELCYEQTHFDPTMADYHAVRRGVYDYSAISKKDGSLVVSCWGQLLKDLGSGVWRYEVTDLSKWTSNPGSRNLFKKHLSVALSEDRPVRLIIAKEKDFPRPEIAGTDGRKIRKEYFAQRDRVGKVVIFDGKRVRIDFKKASASET